MNVECAYSHISHLVRSFKEWFVSCKSMHSCKLSPAQLLNLTRGPNTPEQYAAFTHFCGQTQYSSDAAFVDAASVVVVGLFTVPTPTEADSHFGGGWCWWRPNLWRDSPLTTAAALSEAPICGRSICVVGWAVRAVNMKAVASKHVDCRRPAHRLQKLNWTGGGLWRMAIINGQFG